MVRELVPWAPPLVELPIGAVRHLLTWENEADGSWQAWVSWVQETGGRHVHKLVQVRAPSLRPWEPLEACQRVLGQVRGLEGRFRGAG